ncbi:MAG: hypothetical protein J0H34_16295 [Rhizobiales bacterium]|nr:hypothetical protein [Hyphomicrobiales bacterium]
MAIINFEERSIGRVVDQYLESKRNRSWPVSVADAVKAVRMVSTLPELSDEQLGSMIVAAAVAKGRDVAFDLSDRQASLNPG